MMDKKDHWAWERFTKPGLSKAQLLVHFQHEYQVYVRDFPVLLAKIMAQNPPTEVRQALAENLFEEETGKLSLGVSHPELFLEMMEGLSFSRDDFDGETAIVEEALRYRRFLDKVTSEPPWQVGAAVMTIFVEGNRFERENLQGKRELPEIEDAIRTHPMVRDYGCPPECMRLVRAHRLVEGGHRDDAWSMVLNHVPENGSLSEQVLAAVQEALARWMAYRDGVARAMGLQTQAA